MILKTLVENTSIASKYKSKHGICFYIETKSHKILFDLGQNDLFLKNAIKMGVNVAEIDTVIISHGHIDHAGALKVFLENNQNAKIYIRESAFDRHFTKIMGLSVNVGINAMLTHHPQVVLTKEMTMIDDELMLFSDVTARDLYSHANNALFVENNAERNLDDFNHEQNLIVSDENKYILIGGCSHVGIINIKSKAEEIIGGLLNYVIAGFHLYNPVTRKYENNMLINEIGKRLNNGFTCYYTCHCTGKKAYSQLKKILTYKIGYLSTGSRLDI